MNSSDNPLVSNQVGDFDVPGNYDKFSEIFEREYKKLIDVVNTKEGGLYLPYESATFQKYYSETDPLSTINVYRKVISFGSLPNSGTKSVPHNIDFTSVCRLTRMYGAATDPSTMSYLPLPYSSPTGSENIKLEADSELITIETAMDYSAYVNVTVVIEYLKEQ